MLVTVLAIFSLSVMPALALDWGSGYLSDTGLGTRELRSSVMSIVNIALGFLGIVVIVGIIAGGFMMMTAGGNVEKSGTGQKVVMAGVVGLVIILGALAITNFVVSSLLEATGA